MEELNLFRNAWNTTIEMVQDRGYILPEEYHQITDITFKYMVVNDCLDIVAPHGTDPNRRIYAKFILPNEEKVKASQMKHYIHLIATKGLEECDTVEILLILRNKPNINTAKIEKDTPYDVQIMWCKQLQFNITKHVLVPHHQKCTFEEANALMSFYHLNAKSQLPILNRDDVVARYYNYKTGDIIKISRMLTSVNQDYTSYRYVR